MNSYKIYLTKSMEAARRLATTFVVGDDIQNVSSGMVEEDTIQIPEIYHGRGYFYCLVELAENGEHDSPTYDLTIC